MKKIRPGDVIELQTSKGLTYAIFTHKHEMYGYLIRVFTGSYRTRPDDLSIIFSHPLQITTFFPVGAAVNRGIVALAGNLMIPLALQAFPLFRLPGRQDLRSSTVLTWSLWDGTKSWDIGKLTLEQKRLPMVGIINDTLLIQRIEEGWTPETDALTNR